MDKLLALRTFVTTVRCGGFSAAARQLGLATSSVTRAVNALEQELGCVLLNRNTRQVNVSEAGRDYFERALAILDALDEADAAVADKDDEVRGRLAVSVPVEFARRLIAPHLGELLERHPRLELTLRVTDEVVDLLSERIDLALRLGSSIVSDDVISQQVGRFRRWLVATAIVLDFAVQMSMVLGQRSIYALEPQSRARLNALYMTSIFIGGAIGSALASPIYEQFGWQGAALLGAGLPLLGLLLFVSREP